MSEASEFSLDRNCLLKIEFSVTLLGQTERFAIIIELFALFENPGPVVQTN